MLTRFFQFDQLKTSFSQEILGGLTTFCTMSYIIFVQPAVLSTAGMDFGSVMVATCLASAVATILMAFMANYPIALAPAMGHNFFFAYTVCAAMGVTWQTALGANFIAGIIFIALSAFAFREKVMAAIPDSLKNAIAVGIGLLIALIGLEWAGIVVKAPGTLIGLGHLGSPHVLLAVFGLVVTGILMALNVKGAFLLGILLTTLAGLPFGLVRFEGVVDCPPSLGPTFLKLHIGSAFHWDFFSVILVFFFLMLFDTVGTLIGVAKQGKFMKKGELPRAGRALLADAVGTVQGTVLGTSTVTCYIESSAGVAAGARSGFANLVTAACFIAALFFFPVVKAIGGGLAVDGRTVYPVLAPVLIFVGSFMMQIVKEIEWSDLTESIPAFLTLIIMPATFSITEGIAFGFIAYAVLKLGSGRWRELHPVVAVFAVLFILRYIWLTH